MIDNDNLSKGFRPDPSGSQQIFINDELISGEWVYGWPAQPSDYRIEKAWIITEYPEAVEVVPDSLCQYAGYSTIGHPLCEGDVVRFQYTKFPHAAEGELEYDRGTFGVFVDRDFVPMRDFTDSMFVRNKYDVDLIN
jgi:hypothetical protein